MEFENSGMLQVIQWELSICDVGLLRGWPIPYEAAALALALKIVCECGLAI